MAAESAHDKPLHHTRHTINLPAKIGLGAVLGVAAGIVFGQRAAILEPVGTAYVSMLEIVVFPYVICSLMYGLGRLTPAMSKRFARSAWPAFLLLWAVTFGALCILAQAIPPASPPASLLPSHTHGGVSLLQLLIPSNPFAALRKNYVPAVVIFAIIYGVAFEHTSQKQSLIEIFDAVKKASVKIWSWIVKLAPFGVFALLASTAGTVQPDRLAGLILYVLIYLLGTAILGVVVIPILIASLAPISYREVLRELKPAMVLSIVTTLSVASLPFVQQAAESLLDRVGCEPSEERAGVVDTSLSLSYVFAQLGNYFIYLVILYGSYISDVPLKLAEKLALPLMTLLSCLGSPSATYDGVAFLSSWLHLPKSVLDLYVATSAITRFSQVLLSVAGFFFITLIVPLIYYRKAHLRLPRIVFGVATCALLCTAVATTAMTLRKSLFPPSKSRYETLQLDPMLVQGVASDFEPATADSSQQLQTEQTDVSIEGIRKRGSLRVGFDPHVIPFSYKNSQGKLVGFDIAYAYRLAHDLGVKLEFVPFSEDGLNRDLMSHRFDVAMSGIYDSDTRLQSLKVTVPYYASPLALIVPSKHAADYLDGAAITMRPKLRLAVLDDPVLLQMTRTVFPHAQLITVPSYQDLPDLSSRVDAAVWTLEQASAWASEHSGFTAVGPPNIAVPVPIVYALPPQADDFKIYLNQWLQLRTEDGFRDRQIAYWIDLKPRISQKPRWNLVDYLIQRFRQSKSSQS